jgi:ABC-type uncharacterized transport system substrate-binding protein
MGLVKSLNGPNGNLTGVSFFTTLIGKRLELMRELIGPTGIIAYLQDTNNPAADLEATELQTTAAAVNQKLLILKAANSAEIETGFARAKEMNPSGIIIAAGSFEFRWTNMLLALASRFSLPAMYAGRELVISGGLISYSGSQTEAHRLAGVYCARILKGEKPGQLPVLLPNKLELVVNLKTAKALALKIPSSIIARADEVIE